MTVGQRLCRRLQPAWKHAGDLQYSILLMPQVSTATVGVYLLYVCSMVFPLIQLSQPVVALWRQAGRMARLVVPLGWQAGHMSSHRPTMREGHRLAVYSAAPGMNL